jgi:hypothetical protein
MESTYIIVLSSNKLAFLRVIRLEPYISLLLSAKLFDNYDNINEHLLKGENVAFGDSIKQVQLEIAGEDYSKWIADHDHIYKLVAHAFHLDFLYKRKLIRDTTTRIQPIINELSTISLLKLENEKANIPISRLIKGLSEATKCDEICGYASLIINTYPKLNSEMTISNIHNMVSSVFEQLDKTNLDNTEPLLLKWREDALNSLPLDVVNSTYRDLKNNALNLCAKRDAFVSGFGTEGDVAESASILAAFVADSLLTMDTYNQGCFYSYINLQLESNLLLAKQMFPSFGIPTIRIRRNLDSYKTVNWIVHKCKHRIANTIYNNTKNKLLQLETFFVYVNSLTDKQLLAIDKQLCDKYKRQLCYIDVGIDEKREADDMFVREYELYDEYKQTAYQMRRRLIETLLLSSDLPPVQDINYNFTVFYTFDYHEYSDYNVYMLMASVYSCIREFGSTAQIIVYTTNSNQLTFLFLKYPELYKRVTVRDYFPQRRNNEFSDSNAHFNTIGHARIFLVKELLLESGRPVIYMDNDTGIQLGSGEKCVSLLMKLEKPMGFAEEFYCTFGDLIPDSESELHPINNGIVLYPCNEITLAFADQNIQIYNELSVNSIYNDMLSFTITCQENNCQETIYNGVETPYFIHYYINKHFLDIHDFNSTFYRIFYSGENYQELQL